MNPWELNDQTRKAEEDTTKHEKLLQKMTLKELIDKYGEGVIPQWARDKYERDKK